MQEAGRSGAQVSVDLFGACLPHRRQFIRGNDGSDPSAAATFSPTEKGNCCVLRFHNNIDILQHVSRHVLEQNTQSNLPKRPYTGDQLGTLNGSSL